MRLTLVPDRGEALGYQLESEYRRRAASGRMDDETKQLAQTAAERLASAGRRAVGRGDPTAAVNLFAKASSLLPDTDPLRLRVAPHLIGALVDSGELARAADLLEETSRLADASGDAGLEERLAPFRSELGGRRARTQ